MLFIIVSAKLRALRAFAPDLSLHLCALRVLRAIVIYVSLCLAHLTCLTCLRALGALHTRLIYAPCAPDLYALKSFRIVLQSSRNFRFCKDY